MTIFERISSLAKKRGLSLRTVASKAGLGETTIYGWKKRTPDSSNLQAVANVLGVTVDYLLGKNNTPADATQQEVNDLHRILEQGQLTYREEPVSEEAQDAVKTLLEAYYWKKGRNRVNHNKKDDKE